MSRVAQTLKSQVILVYTAVFILIAGIGTGIYVHNNDSGSKKTNTHNQVEQISYNGQDGINPYTLLQKRATVQANHSSAGYVVTSIDGVKGLGPKYWILYINGKRNLLGASTYTTKNSDKIIWKLEPL